MGVHFEWRMADGMVREHITFVIHDCLTHLLEELRDVLVEIVSLPCALRPRGDDHDKHVRGTRTALQHGANEMTVSLCAERIYIHTMAYPWCRHCALRADPCAGR